MEGISEGVKPPQNLGNALIVGEDCSLEHALSGRQSAALGIGGQVMRRSAPDSWEWLELLGRGCSGTVLPAHHSALVRESSMSVDGSHSLWGEPYLEQHCNCVQMMVAGAYVPLLEHIHSSRWGPLPVHCQLIGVDVSKPTVLHLMS